ncbi:SnoaL-like polyketide cyclase [Streptomyces pluripotens]|uniref:SnoaL-like polyketide cyclase n=1 Tax=Streptomyces pluripotens TaxID=1355015 RepID=A0A221P802_9ACTN|nr:MULTISPECIES: nuclear transport factor 2 family protein [Streptomyces]ARP74060.1 SnoaL-like polyketide cyclase [Streptomyces pluripotens]ASN28320.1 SnoaL-like polyketide cyclase [Streptomyces pluripotens]KIE25213.1 SnoaL-like polyketide cyclase [Streptomyces sp. MUSC 125]MCH0559160.1 nuclear transport factor 2 family protein [Streptomyces sp. MUM 16J]
MAEHPHATLVRKGYEAFSRGDMDVLRGMMTADCTQHVPGSHPLSGDFKGQDAIIEMYGRLFQESNGTLRIALRDAFVDGRGHVVALHHCTAERNGRRYDKDEVMVFRLVGDKVSDVDLCVPDLDEADSFWS